MTTTTTTTMTVMMMMMIDDEKRKFLYGAFQKTHNVLYINKVSYRQNTQ